VRNVWTHTAAFLKKAGTVILLSSLLVWALSHLRWESGALHFSPSLEGSLLAQLGRTLYWLFAPLGFPGWEPVVATLTALLAKENAVSTLGILYNAADVAQGGASALALVLARVFNPLSGFCFLLFNLLCAPCVAAMAALRRALGSLRRTLYALGYQTLFAYAATFLVYQLGRVLCGGAPTVLTAIALPTLVLLLLAVFLPSSKPLVPDP
jgi:ferrous iron transport protein B